MEKVSQTPHDAVFRQMLMHHAVAKDFMQLYLPAPFLAICELDSLQLVSGSFVEEDLRASYSDILYSLRTRHGPGYVYALIEHQSTCLLYTSRILSSSRSASKKRRRV